MEEKHPSTPADALVSFLNALIIPHESRSIEELRESVQSQGIDPDRLLARAREQVARAQEQARLSWAKHARARLPKIRTHLRETPIAPRLTRNEQVRRVREAVEGAFGERAREFVASFRNFADLPDTDLASLVEDIEALRFLEEEPVDEGQ